MTVPDFARKLVILIVVRKSDCEHDHLSRSTILHLLAKVLKEHEDDLQR